MQSNNPFAIRKQQRQEEGFSIPQSTPQKKDEAVNPFLSRKMQMEKQHFKEIKFPDEKENDLEREIERNIAQQTSRIGETIVGAPGDIYSFAKSIFGFDPETNLPTSGSLRELSEKSSLGYTKPKNEVEEKAGEVMQDIASFMLPGAGKYNILRNIGIPLAANLAQEGIKYSGDEKTALASKMGIMIGLDLLTHKGKGAKSFAGQLFNDSEKLVKEGATLKSPKLQKSILNLEKSFESGGTSPSKEKAVKKLNELKDRMLGDEIEVRELIDFRKSINEIKSEMGGFEVQLPKHIKKKAILNLDKVKNEVVQALDEYGMKHNPEFRVMNRSANEAYAAYEGSDKIARFIKKHASPKNPIIKGLFGLGGITGAIKYPSIALQTGVALPAAYVTYESYKVLHQVIKSPTLRKFYGNILKGATSGNASQVSKNMKALDQEIEKLEIQ